MGGLLLICATTRSRDVAAVMGKALIELSAALFAVGVIAFLLRPRMWLTIPLPSAIWSVVLVAVLISLASLPRVRVLPGAIACAIAAIAIALPRIVGSAVSMYTMMTPFVLLAAGGAGLIAAICAGPRAGKYNRDGSANVILGHFLPMQYIGAILIGFGVMTSQLSTMGAGEITACLIAAAGATLASAAGAWMVFRRIDFSILPLAFAMGVMIGTAIIPAGVSYSPHASVLFSVLLGGALPWMIAGLDMRLRVDEPGGLAVPLILAGACGLPYRLLTLQHRTDALIWCIGATLLTLASVAAVYLVARRFKQLRISAEVESEGSDLLVHDLNAYPDFTQPMIRSYHLRQ